MYFLLFLIILAVAGMVWFRLAPNDEQRWHVLITDTENADHIFGVTRVIDGSPATLDAFNTSFLSEPRTKILAGAVQDGHITYVTRSKFWGFPDYTTVQLMDDQLRIFARLRFGRSDLGVNRARIDRVLAALKG
ncbi:MAG: DUF1499 domain-containing protein [Paracoccaceae bacterium]